MFWPSFLGYVWGRIVEQWHVFDEVSVVEVDL